MFPADAAAFVLFAAVMSATPGPNNAMLAASGASFGFRRTVPHMAGVAVGFPLMLLLVALGAGQVLRAYPQIHGVLRWVGAAYLLWLAWRIAMMTPELDEAGTARPLSMVQAGLFQWVNPKAWMIAVGAVATYTTAGGAVVREAAWLAAVMLVVSIPCVALWAALGSGAALVLRSPGRLRWFNRAMAGLLVVSLVPMLWGE